jgi:hypothetical protein
MSSFDGDIATDDQRKVPLTLRRLLLYRLKTVDSDFTVAVAAYSLGKAGIGMCTVDKERMFLLSACVQAIEYEFNNS